jgi:hypothetical protein
VRGRPQRESAAITLRDTGFYDRLPKIRKDSKDYLVSSRERLLRVRPDPKMTRNEALGHREEFRKGQPRILEPFKFTVTSLGTSSLEPSSESLQPQELIQHGEVDITGSGLGFDTGTAAIIGALGLLTLAEIPNLTGDFTQKSFQGDWYFKYTPPKTDVYRLSTGLLSWGKYVLISDDGPFDSHEVSLGVIGFLECENRSTSQIFTRQGANINEADSFAGSTDCVVMVPLTANVEATIHAGVIAGVAARGDDTFAQIDMTDPAGGMLCPGVKIEQFS